MRKLTILSLGILTLTASVKGYAGPREQARRIYQSLAGVPPTATVLDQIEAMVTGNKPADVASLAMDDENFLRVTVAQMSKAWTNKQHLIDFDLNDYSATVIGVVRDDVDARELVKGDIIYTGADGLAGVAAYAPTNNTHYKNFQDQRKNYKTELVRKSQVAVTGLALSAGVMTLRGFGAAYYFAGTNRAAWENVANVFLGKQLRAMHDVTLGAANIRRDVDRQPGGDALKFQSECVGCHGGMDGMSKAFAHFDWDVTANQERIIYNTAVIPAKMTRNQETYPFGYLVQDDHWISLYQNGINSYMGFEGAFEGDGVKSMGEFIAASKQFSRGMAQSVFAAVCGSEPSAIDGPTMDKMAKAFSESGFKMKTMFSAAAIGCMGE